MASPSPVRTQICFLGFHDPSGASGPLYGADDLATDDTQAGAIFGYPCIVRGVFLHVVENQSAHTETVTLKWRPTPGSATDEVTVGTYVVPASVTAGSRLYRNFYDQNVTTATTVGAGGEDSQYGLGGSTMYAGDEDVIIGPGGEFELEDAGSSTAGQYNVWLNVEFLSMENAVVAPTVMAAS